MPRPLLTLLAAVALLSATPSAFATIGDAPGVPGQLVDEGPLAPSPLCQTESVDSDQADGSPGELRVGTYNVLHTQDPDGNPTAPQRIGMLADAIEGSGADVLGLQEVAKSAKLAGLVDDADDDDVQGLMVELIAQDLAAGTGDDWHWCWFASNAHLPHEPEPSAGGGGGPLTEAAAVASGQQTGNGNEFREGVALLSRYPIAEATVKRLSLRAHEAAFCDEIDPIGCQFAVAFDSRVIMHGVIDAPGGEVDLYTTHIANGVTTESDATKARQIREGLEHIAATADPGTPTFYVGDYNTTSDSPRYTSILDAGFIDAYVAAASHGDADPIGTSSQDVVGDALTVDRTIDFVFARGLRDGCVVSLGDIIGDVSASRSDTPDPTDRVWPSDHLGVVTTITCS